MATARETELEHHIRTLRDALQDAPHSSAIDLPFYDAWYRQQRGPALDQTDPDRWKEYRAYFAPHLEKSKTS